MMGSGGMKLLEGPQILAYMLLDGRRRSKRSLAPWTRRRKASEEASGFSDATLGTQYGPYHVGKQGNSSLQLDAVRGTCDVAH